MKDIKVNYLRDEEDDVAEFETDATDILTPQAKELQAAAIDFNLAVLKFNLDDRAVNFLCQYYAKKITSIATAYDESSLVEAIWEYKH